MQLQYERPDIQFYIPEEGGMSWYDTMVIPKGAPNGVAAAEWMNFVYDPVQAAQLTYWVQYLSPVKGVKEELIKMGGDAAELADSPILFPDEETSARLKVFAELPDDVEARLNDALPPRHGEHDHERPHDATRRIATPSALEGGGSRICSFCRGWCSCSCSSSSR